MTRIILIFNFIVLPLCYSKGQNGLEPINNLNDRWLYPVSNITADIGVNHDLDFIKNVIGDKRIVLLGEASHFDGSTAQAKVQLINYLHSEMGFNSLFIEKGFTEVDRAYRDIIEKRDSAVGVFCWLTKFFGSTIAQDERNLARLIDESQSTKNPLKLYGFDVHENSVYMNSFFKELENLLAKHETDYQNSNTQSIFIEFSQKGKFTSITSSEQYSNSMNSIDISRSFILANELMDRLEVLKSSVGDIKEVERISFFQQGIISRHNSMKFEKVLSSTDIDNEDLGNDWTKERDKDMSDNILWFLKNNPSEKVIISGATYHISKDFRKGDVPVKFHGNVVPMGHYIWEQYKEQVYSVSFVSHHGFRGENNRSSDPTYEKIKVAPKSSIEGRLHSMKMKYAFVNLQSRELPNWLKKPNCMNPAFNRPAKGDWSQIYEGLFFIDVMVPCNVLGYKERAGLQQPYFTPEEWFRSN